MLLTGAGGEGGFLVYVNPSPAISTLANIQVYGLTSASFIQVGTPTGQPLSTVTLGGRFKASHALANGTVALLPVPTTGTCFTSSRDPLDRLSPGLLPIDEAAGGIGGVICFVPQEEVLIFGQLCFGSLNLQASSPTGGTVYVTYEVITVPEINCSATLYGAT